MLAMPPTPASGIFPLIGWPVEGTSPLNSGHEKMAQDNRSDLARLERMERRLQALEDAEAIRNLKARYAALCDNQYDADGIAMLFTEDALWERPGLGRFEGREALRAGRLGGRDRKRKPRVPPLRRLLGAELTIS